MKQKLFLFFLIIQNFNITPLPPKPTQQDVEKMLRCRITLSFIDRLEQRRLTNSQEFKKLQEEKNKFNCADKEYEEFLRFLKLENAASKLKRKLDQELQALYQRANMSYADFNKLNKETFMSVIEIAQEARNA